jgi:hypothetical protein
VKFHFSDTWARKAAEWYRAGVQADVWRRQGAEMSTWEVFLGAKPIIRGVVQESPP